MLCNYFHPVWIDVAICGESRMKPVEISIKTALQSVTYGRQLPFGGGLIMFPANIEFVIFYMWHMSGVFW